MTSISMPKLVLNLSLKVEYLKSGLPADTINGSFFIEFKKSLLLSILKPSVFDLVTTSRSMSLTKGFFRLSEPVTATSPASLRPFMPVIIFPIKKSIYPLGKSFEELS